MTSKEKYKRLLSTALFGARLKCTIALVLLIFLVFSGAVSGRVASATTTRTIGAVPITISVVAGTPNPFQQEIVFNPSSYSTYESSDLGNIRFCSDSQCAMPLSAWLESCTPSCSPSATSATVWVKLSSPTLTSGGTIIIYMVFLPLTTEFDGNYWGEAPQLSPSYAAYDNGANVFTFYYAFPGTALTSMISGADSDIVLSQNNGLEIYTGIGGASNYIMLNQQFSDPFVYEALVTAQNAGSDFNFQEGLVLDSNTSTSFGVPGWTGGTNYMMRLTNDDPSNSAYATCLTTKCGYFDMWEGGTFGSYTNQLSVLKPAPPRPTYPYTSIESFEQNGAGSLSAFDNGLSLTGSPSSCASCLALSSGYIGFYNQVSSSGGNDMFVQWIRVRAYPPGGIMPSYSFGSFIVVTPEFPLGSILSVVFPLLGLSALFLIKKRAKREVMVKML